MVTLGGEMKPFILRDWVQMGDILLVNHVIFSVRFSFFIRVLILVFEKYVDFI